MLSDLFGVLVIRLLFGVIRSVRAMSLLNPRSAVTRLLFCFVLSVSTMSRNAAAQEATVVKDIRSLDELISILKSHSGTSSGTIEIPSDAIVVPYQPDSPPLPAGAEKILVPYSIYTQLMNLANPDKADKKFVESPVEYSLSNLSYEATLDRDDFLSVTLRIDITPQTERGILVPFGFQGAVLTSTKLNDEAAAISSGSNGLALLVKGMRSHTFIATLQIPIQRQGGWRIVNATLPTALSGKMQLSVPLANTEVRLLGLPDVEQRETTQSNETIETSIATDGKLSLQ